MNIIQAIVYGIVQGIGEFLPISSTAHLVLIPWMFGCFIVGISQVFAIIPGVSRSGITMSAGRLLGIERESIAKFTFLLSTPIIIGDSLYHVTKMGAVPIDISSFIVAILTAAIVGFLSIKFLLNYLKTKGFGVFAIYRFILGVVVIATYFARIKL